MASHDSPYDQKLLSPFAIRYGVEPKAATSEDSPLNVGADGERHEIRVSPGAQGYDIILLSSFTMEVARRPTMEEEAWLARAGSNEWLALLQRVSAECWPLRVAVVVSVVPKIVDFASFADGASSLLQVGAPLWEWRQDVEQRARTKQAHEVDIQRAYSAVAADERASSGQLKDPPPESLRRKARLFAAPSLQKNPSSKMAEPLSVPQPRCTESGLTSDFSPLTSKNSPRTINLPRSPESKVEPPPFTAELLLQKQFSQPETEPPPSATPTQVDPSRLEPTRVELSAPPLVQQKFQERAESWWSVNTEAVRSDKAEKWWAIPTPGTVASPPTSSVQPTMKHRLPAALPQEYWRQKMQQGKMLPMSEMPAMEESREETNWQERAEKWWGVQARPDKPGEKGKPKSLESKPHGSEEYRRQKFQQGNMLPMSEGSMEESREETNWQGRAEKWWGVQAKSEKVVDKGKGKSFDGKSSGGKDPGVRTSSSGAVKPWPALPDTAVRPLPDAIFIQDLEQRFLEPQRHGRPQETARDKVRTKPSAVWKVRAAPPEEERPEEESAQQKQSLKARQQSHEAPEVEVPMNNRQEGDELKDGDEGEWSQSKDAHYDRQGEQRSRREVLSQVNRHFTGVWAGEKGETYSCWRVEPATWTCMRHDDYGRSKNFPIHADVDTRRLYWGVNRMFHIEFDGILKGYSEVTWVSKNNSKLQDVTWFKIEGMHLEEGEDEFENEAEAEAFDEETQEDAESEEEYAPPPMREAAEAARRQARKNRSDGKQRMTWVRK